MLEIVEASAGYGERLVVRELSLALAAGEIGCLLGASGCGKTTLLRAVAGFEPLRGGRIVIDGITVAGPGLHVPTPRRGIGMVFQEHALFAHLDVAHNVGFGLGGLARDERARRVDDLLALVGLAGLGRHWPHALSGGQQQRVALARALAPRPRLLLLDEPFSNLDTRLRESLAREVRSILRAAGTTALMVTHDQQEAFALADRVGVMADGVLHQWAAAPALYQQPASSAVARFVGEGTLLPARPASGGGWHTAAGEAPAGTPVLPAGAADVDAGSPQVLLRPEAVQLQDGAALQARVLVRTFRGQAYVYELQLDDGTRLLAQGAPQRPQEVGARVGLRVLWPQALPDGAAG